MTKSAWQRLLDGWPVYTAVAGALFMFSEYWVEAKIREGIKSQTSQVTAITDIRQSLSLATVAAQTNLMSINRVEGKVEEVERDTKAILLHLAGD